MLAVSLLNRRPMLIGQRAGRDIPYWVSALPITVHPNTVCDWPLRFPPPIDSRACHSNEAPAPPLPALHWLRSPSVTCVLQSLRSAGGKRPHCALLANANVNHSSPRLFYDFRFLDQSRSLAGPPRRATQRDWLRTPQSRPRTAANRGASIGPFGCQSNRHDIIAARRRLTFSHWPLRAACNR